jgi:hypothetical protein
MASYTTNLNLKKPGDSDTYDIDDFNGNMDTLDAKVGAVGNTSLQAQVTALGESVSQFALTRSATKFEAGTYNGTEYGFEFVLHRSDAVEFILVVNDSNDGQIRLCKRYNGQTTVLCRWYSS